MYGRGQRDAGKTRYQLDAGLEQLTAVMMGGDMVEIKAVAVLDFLVLRACKGTGDHRYLFRPSGFKEASGRITRSADTLFSPVTVSG